MQLYGYPAAMIAKIPWLALALLHLMPAAALFRPALMTQMYGLPAGSPLVGLMQHRAALFLCILIAAVWAAFDPSVRRTSVILIGVSMLSFIAIYFAHGQPESLRTIAIADLVFVPFLIWAAYDAFGRTV